MVPTRLTPLLKCVVHPWTQVVVLVVAVDAVVALVVAVVVAAVVVVVVAVVVAVLVVRSYEIGWKSHPTLHRRIFRYGKRSRPFHRFLKVI